MCDSALVLESWTPGKHLLSPVGWDPGETGGVWVWMIWAIKTVYWSFLKENDERCYDSRSELLSTHTQPGLTDVWSSLVTHFWLEDTSCFIYCRVVQDGTCAADFTNIVSSGTTAMTLAWLIERSVWTATLLPARTVLSWQKSLLLRSIVSTSVALIYWVGFPENGKLMVLFPWIHIFWGNGSAMPVAVFLNNWFPWIWKRTLQTRTQKAHLRRFTAEE